MASSTSRPTPYVRPKLNTYESSPIATIFGEQMAQRQLILVTKVLQNLANDTLPGAKEVNRPINLSSVISRPTLYHEQAYMERLNAFIVSNKPALGRFYDQIVDHPERGKLTNLTVCHHIEPSVTLELTQGVRSLGADSSAQ